MIKMFRLLGVLTLCASGLATACGGDKPPGAPTLYRPQSGGHPGDSGPPDETGGSAGRAGAGGRSSGGSAGRSAGGSGGETGDGGVDAPVVTITNPKAAKDPNKDEIVANGVGDVKDDIVTVICTAIPVDGESMSRVKSAFVSIVALDAMGAVIQPTPPMVKQNPARATEYTASFNFAMVPNGAIAFRCTATSEGGGIGTDTVSTFVDHGPKITPATPIAESAHSATGAFPVEFTVDEVPINQTDESGNLSKVELKIQETPIDLIDLKDAQDSKDPKHFSYSLSVNPADRVLFPGGLDGRIAIEIAATNARGVKATNPYHFVVDARGPQIDITSPPINTVIGGSVPLDFTVTDAESGVDEPSLVITLNQDVHRLPSEPTLWTRKGNGSYTFPIDSAKITGGDVQISVVIEANDNAGNVSRATSTYYFDTKPPTVDLDPPPLQEIKYISSTSSLCSAFFDPLGDAANDFTTDHKVIESFAEFRVLAWDEGNHASGQKFPRFSRVDPSTVLMYIQADNGKGLLIDSNGDGTCDDIDKNAATAKQMYVVTPNKGSASYKQPTPEIAGVCTTGTDTSDPPYLCPSLPDLTRVIQHTQAGTGEPEGVVYALNPTDGECSSTELQLDSVVTKNGWVCVAAIASDKTGNVGVSAPMRLCLWNTDPKKNFGGKPACAMDGAQPPSCTKDDCTPPPHFGRTAIDIPHP